MLLTQTATLPVAGTLYSWGNNSNGELGLEDTDTRLSPQPLTFLRQQHIKIAQVSCGAKHCVAIALGAGAGTSQQSSASVLTWGAGVVNGFTERQRRPAQVAALTRARVAFASGTHSMCINDSLHAIAFGVNDHGELGNGRPKIQVRI